MSLREELRPQFDDVMKGVNGILHNKIYNNIDYYYVIYFMDYICYFYYNKIL